MGLMGTTEIIVIATAILLIVAPTLGMKYIKTYKKAKIELKKNDILTE